MTCWLASLIVVAAQSHDSESAAGDLLIEKEHEGSSQHRLQQLGLQAFEQTQHAILPIEGHQGENMEHMYVKYEYMKEQKSLLTLIHEDGISCTEAKERAA